MSRLFGLLGKSVLVMFIWNLLVPDLFGGPIIRFGQALLLVVLVHLLTGRFGRRRRKDRERKFKAKLEILLDKLEESRKMSPEEKEKFKKGFTSGKWDVNVVEIEVEEEKEEEEDEDVGGDDSKS